MNGWRGEISQYTYRILLAHCRTHSPGGFRAARLLCVGSRQQTAKIGHPDYRMYTSSVTSLATGAPVTPSKLVGCFAFRQVIEKRHLISAGTFAIVGIETLTGFPVRASFLLNTFLNVFCSHDSEFLLSGCFANGIQFRLLRFTVTLRFTGHTRKPGQGQRSQQ